MRPTAGLAAHKQAREKAKGQRHGGETRWPFRLSADGRSFAGLAGGGVGNKIVRGHESFGDVLQAGDRIPIGARLILPPAHHRGLRNAELRRESSIGQRVEGHVSFELHARNMHRMHKTVKSEYACLARDKQNGLWQFPRMPPVKKLKPAQRCRTFLKEWREHRGLTLEAAADRMDIHYTTLARIERGQSPYNQDFLERAALAYGCEVSDLLTMNPLAPDTPRLVYDAVRGAGPERQREVWRVVQAMLKAG